MSFKVVNRIDRDFRWDNGSNPYGFNIPFPTTEDNGKVLSVVEGNYSLTAASGGETYTAGDNIQISDANVISATDTKYTAGDGIEISESNVISAVQPTTSAILLSTASNQVIKDGYSNVLQITDRDYDEIIIEIGAIPDMSYDLYTLVKGGCINVDPEKMNSKYLRGIKSHVPKTSSLWEVIQPYMFDNLVVYSKRVSDSDLNNHLFAIYASSYKRGTNTYITIDCVADDSNINLFPNNNIFIWGIKTV